MRVATDLYTVKFGLAVGVSETQRKTLQNFKQYKTWRLH
jgi:hypothetical protein